MTSAVTYSEETRHAVAHLIARFFLLHLLVEIEKPDEILLEDYPHLPVRKMTADLITRVRTEFGIDEQEPLPEFNLFKKWCELNGKFTYEEAAFVGPNQTFLNRLLDLRDRTPESRQAHYSAMRAIFSRFDYEKHGFTVAFFLDSETIMRELLRRVVRDHLPDIKESADDLIMTQSRAYLSAMYEYFEGVLKTTLADNVRLLHGILPQQVASELRQNGFVKPVHFQDVAVLFTDFERFSQYTERLEPGEVLRRLDLYFSEFDRISAIHGLEKIKTIGDSYMAVAGVPEPHGDPVRATCDAALEILEASQRISSQDGPEGWKIRIGIHVGPLMAGVIGKQKFSYDVWGATVNFASRMESSGEPGKINVSEAIHSRAQPHYHWEARGHQPVKRLGTAEMFFLLGPRSSVSSRHPTILG
jgi:class 3 adenylate cyclase